MKLKHRIRNARRMAPPLIRSTLGRGNDYDFAVLSFGNVGTMAVNVLLDDHPQISLPYFGDSSEILYDEKTGPRAEANGLMLHYPHETKAARKLIRARVKGEVLLQFVREPVSNAHSMYNRLIFQSRLGGEPIPSFEDFLSDQTLMSHLLPFQSARPIADGFSRWEVFDLPELMPDAIDQTLSEIFSLLSVRSDVEIVDRKRRFANDFETFIYYGFAQGITVELAGRTFPVHLSIERGLSLPRSFDTEIFRRPASSPHADENRRAIFRLRSEDWASLPKALQKNLQNDPATQSDLSERCFQKLDAHYEEFDEDYQRLKVEGLTRSQRAKLAGRVADDAKNLCGRFEKLRQGWSENLS